MTYNNISPPFFDSGTIGAVEEEEEEEEEEANSRRFDVGGSRWL